MKILISVSSKTGNTRKIAEAIHAALPEAELHNVENAPNPAAFDLILWDSGLIKGQPTRKPKSIFNKSRTKQWLFLEPWELTPTPSML